MPNRLSAPSTGARGLHLDDQYRPRAGEGQRNTPTPIPPRRRPRRKRDSAMGTAIGIALLCVLAAIGSYAGYLYRSSSAFQKYVPSILDNASVATEFPGVKSIDLLLIGRDYDYNNQDQVIKTHARSDMLMVARIDFAADTARILSIPRDTAAEIPGHGLSKINAAHAFGGPNLTAATLQQNFGITPDHYIALDFQGFQEAIDELGGVDCAVDKRMDYDDNWGHLHIHLLPGMQHLDGEQAMGFVRFRHSDNDILRASRQQTLLASLETKLAQPATLFLLPSLLDTVDRHVDSDLTDSQKVALGRFLHAMPKDNIEMATLPSRPSGDLVLTNFAQASPLVKTWFGVDMPDSVRSAAFGSRERAPRHSKHRHHGLDAAQPQVLPSPTDPSLT